MHPVILNTYWYLIVKQTNYNPLLCMIQSAETSTNTSSSFSLKGTLSQFFERINIFEEMNPSQIFDDLVHGNPYSTPIGQDIGRKNLQIFESLKKNHKKYPFPFRPILQNILPVISKLLSSSDNMRQPQQHSRAPSATALSGPCSRSQKEDHY